MMQRQTAIVLQGGGALGAYELGVLKRLYEQKDFQPSVVAGVSIGAITAAAVVGAKNADPIATLEAMWRDFQVLSSPFIPDTIESALSVFGNPSFFRPRTDVFNWAHWTSFYDSAPLRTTLDRYVSFERIAGSPTRLILTATDVATGRTEPFDNRGATPIEAKDVLASASLPPAFPPTGIGGRTFWDGGLFDNTPLTPVIKAVDADQDPQIIVVNLFPAKGSIPRNMPEVFGRAIQIMLANKIQDNVELTLEVSEYVQLVNEIKSNPGLTDAVRALPGFQRLERYKLLQNIVYITNTDAESATAFFDFSRAAIERRIASGYRDADSALNHPLRTSADAEQMRAK